MVYVRTCVAGSVESKFIGIKAVEKADAENITDAVKEVMGTLSEDWEKKLVAITTDGVAVMTGSKNGVVGRQFQRCNKRRQSFPES